MPNTDKTCSRVYLARGRNRVRRRVRKFAKNTLHRIIGFLFDFYHSTGAFRVFVPPIPCPFPPQGTFYPVILSLFLQGFRERRLNLGRQR